MFHRLYTVPDPRRSFFLFGPRGTGKTTWLLRHLNDPLILDLLDDSTYQELLANPSRLEQRLIAHPKTRWIVIDEVQRIPALLNTVHRLIELKHFKFALTGSSARKLRQKGVNLLAGRALTSHLFPLVVAELGVAFHLQESLKRGHLPSVFSASNPEKYLKSYCATYLREEIQQEGMVRNLPGFMRFLEAASFSQAQILNVSALSRECHVERKAVEDYFSILEDLLIAFRLPVFSKKTKRKLITNRKFFFFDCGVFQALRPTGPLDSESEIAGPALETLVVQEIRAMNEYQDWGYELSYWHTADHRYEVDLVAYGKRGLKAIEIKLSSRLREGDLNGLLEFKKDYPMAELFLFYGGNESIKMDGVQILPAEKALRSLDQIFK